jgi:hypothetical protein
LHIETTDSGGATSGINLDNVFSSSFRNYKVFINLSAGSALQALNLRLRVGGTDNSTANSYSNQFVTANSTTIQANQTVSNLMEAVVYGTDATFRTGYEITFYNPFLAQPTAIESIGVSANTNARFRHYAAIHNQSTSYDGFSLYTGGGTVTVEKLSVYGLKEV